MTPRYVAGHEVKPDPNFSPVRVGDELTHILVGAQLRINREIVNRVVAVIRFRRAVWREPQARHTQVSEVRQRLPYAAQRAAMTLAWFLTTFKDAVRSSRVKTIEEDLVDDRLPHPVGERISRRLDRVGKGGEAFRAGKPKPEALAVVRPLVRIAVRWPGCSRSPAAYSIAHG